MVGCVGGAGVSAVAGDGANKIGRPVTSERGAGGVGARGGVRGGG
eukprot:COSAG02_NODE_60592_length_271_cov_0.552326_1_plen_44_part_01